MSPKISIVIIHWQTPKLLRAMLSKLSTSKWLQIIVVDNNSLSSSDQKKLSSDYAKVQWHFLAHNSGFAHAANLGSLNARTKWLMFLNPDFDISPQDIEEMLKFARDNFLKAVSPASASSGYQKPLPSFTNLFLEFTPFGKIIKNKSKDLTLIGGCLLIQTQTFREIGGWDERFWLWFEDSDLSYRLKKLGIPFSRSLKSISHQGAASIKKLSDADQKDVFFLSLRTFSKKHFNWWQQKIIDIVSYRFSTRKVLPVLNEGVSVTVPNLKLNLLNNFLKNNLKVFNSFSQVCVVSSSLDSTQLWAVRRQFPQIRFISIIKNKGFASTTNIGLKTSHSFWNGTVNDDVILSPDFVNNVLKGINGKHTGSINPVVKTTQGKVESAGIQVLKKGKAKPLTKISSPRPYTTDASNAACVIYNQEALNQVGLFDEKFESYLEDIDLSLRLKRAGWKNYVNPNSQVVHAHRSSSQKLGRYKNWLDAKNWWLVVLKNWQKKDLISHSPHILLERLRNISGLVKGS